jgi:hypothetical protein
MNNIDHINMQPNLASFRDRDASVVEQDGRVFRGLSRLGAEHWVAFAKTGAFARLSERALIPRTVVAQADTQEIGAEWALVLEHEKIPLISYPYEWTFGMLKDAALAQLDILQELLQDGLILKDGSSYNTQWNGVRPVFIDVGSIMPITGTFLWEGYRQFCHQHLNPLLLQSCLGIEFRPMLRGRIAGISANETARILKRRHLLRPSILANVFLQAHLEGRASAPSAPKIHQTPLAAKVVSANVRKLRRLISGLTWTPDKTVWTEYGARTHYEGQSLNAKMEFVQTCLSSRLWGTVWDIGSNDGLFSRMAARYSERVIAIEADGATADRLYNNLKLKGPGNITPLVIDVADASPAQGWQGGECHRLERRIPPDLILSLAVIHHLVIGANLPLQQVMQWLARHNCALIIEYVDRDDLMVQKLLSTRRDVFHDYNSAAFHRALNQYFAVHRSTELPGGTRTLHFAISRSTPSCG